MPPDDATAREQECRDSDGCQVYHVLQRPPEDAPRGPVTGVANDPDIAVTLGAWHPRCALMVAGHDLGSAAVAAAEQRCDFAQDSFASPADDSAARLTQPASWRARRSDVCVLHRASRIVLRARLSHVPSGRS